MTRDEILSLLDDIRERPARCFTEEDYWEDDDGNEQEGTLMEVVNVKCKLDGKYISCQLRLGSIGSHGLFLNTERAVLYTFDSKKREVAVSMSREKCNDIDDAIRDLYYQY